MIKLTFNSTMNAIEFGENNIKKIEEKFDVSIIKRVSYIISDDDDRQHWEDIKPGDYVCKGESESHITIIDANRFQGLVDEAIQIDPIPEVE